MTELDDTAGGVIAFATRYNEPGKRDATGAFQPRARAFCRMHGGHFVLFDDSKPMRARGREIVDYLEQYAGRPLVSVAFFCHGWSRGIEAGFDLREGRGLSVDVLAGAIAAKSGAGVIVPLFCCSTADSPHEAPGGDGGFADELRDALCRAGATNCRIDAHDRDGHTTRNPFVRRFEGEHSPVGGAGGRYLVRPRGPLWSAWVAALRGRDDFDVVYPFLDTKTIARRLQAI